jgi:hypothetical protein
LESYAHRAIPASVGIRFSARSAHAARHSTASTRNSRNTPAPTPASAEKPTNSLHFEGVTASIHKTSPFLFFTRLHLVPHLGSKPAIAAAKPAQQVHFDGLTPSIYETSSFFIFHPLRSLPLHGPVGLAAMEPHAVAGAAAARRIHCAMECIGGEADQPNRVSE